jgi:hypothetical protein
MRTPDHACSPDASVHSSPRPSLTSWPSGDADDTRPRLLPRMLHARGRGAAITPSNHARGDSSLGSAPRHEGSSPPTSSRWKPCGCARSMSSSPSSSAPGRSTWPQRRGIPTPRGTHARLGTSPGTCPDTGRSDDLAFDQFSSKALTREGSGCRSAPQIDPHDGRFVVGSLDGVGKLGVDVDDVVDVQEPVDEVGAEQDLVENL